MEDLQLDDLQPLLLIGAGASKPFGVPIMNAFLDEKREEIEEPIAGGFAVRRSVDLTGGVDLEEVMYLLENLAGMQREDALATPFLKVVRNKYQGLRKFPGFSGIRTQAREILEELREYIFDTCVEYDRELARTTYERLLQSLYEIWKPNRIYIATTNYDRIIEDMWQRNPDQGPHTTDPALALQTGFYQPDYGTPAAPELEVARGFPELGDDEDCAIHLIKLHGSIGWRQYDPGTVQDTQALEYAQGNTVLAYPIRSDKSETPPFAELFDEFDRALAESNLILIIGSSLRDEAIVSHIAEALRPGEKVAVIIDPNAESVRNKLPSSVRKYVIPREEYFGPKGFSPSGMSDWNGLISEVLDRWSEAKKD